MTANPEKTVSNESQINSGEPTKIDSGASEACTRSGTFALLLSLLCFLLTPYWVGRQNEIALKQYLAHRFNLATTTETITEDPTWRKYQASHPGWASTPIAQLLKDTVELSSSDTNPTNPPSKPAKDARNESHDQSHAQTSQPRNQRPIAAPHVPAAPVLLRVAEVGQIDYIPQLTELLNGLNDSDLLSRSRQVSRFFDYSIVRWVRKRGNIMYGNSFSNVCTPNKELEVPDQAKKSLYADYYTPRLDPETMLSCLTFQDVQDLAHFELPTITNPTQLGGALSNRD